MTYHGRTLWLLLVAALIPFVSGCRDEARGPAVLEGAIDGPGPVGAAFFVLPMDGVSSVEALGGDYIFTRGVPEDGVIRVVLVAGEGTSGPLRFRVQVEDGRGPHPQGSLVQLADMENRPIPNLTGYRIQIRP